MDALRLCQGVGRIQFVGQRDLLGAVPVIPYLHLVTHKVTIRDGVPLNVQLTPVLRVLPQLDDRYGRGFKSEDGGHLRRVL